MTINWEAVLADGFKGIESIILGVGVMLGFGGGAGLVAYLHHMPPPYEDQVWWGSVYDTLQDRVKNTDRIRLRRKRSGDDPVESKKG